MTALTTILGMVPLAIELGSGAETWSPLAITVLGGLLISTPLTLFIVPSIYLLFTDIPLLFKPRQKKSYSYDWKGFERVSDLPKK